MAMFYLRWGRWFVAGMLVAIVGSLVAVGPAAADSFDPARRAAEAQAAQAAQAAAAIATTIVGLDAQLARAGIDLRDSQARLAAAQADLAAAQQDLERNQRAATLVAARLHDAESLQTHLAATVTRNDERTTQAHLAVGQLAREAYKGETAATGLSLVFGASSTQDMVDRYGLVATALRVQTNAVSSLAQLAANNRSDQARLTAVTKRIADLKAEADTQVARADAARADAAARQVEITQLITDLSAKQAALSTLQAQALAEQAKIDAQRAVIAAQLAGILASQRAARASASASATGASSVTCTTGAPSAGAPLGGLPAAIGPYRGEQVINAAQIIIAANDLGIDVHGQIIGIMTAIGESGLVNVDHGDLAGPDSRGLFQQRANGAWGSYADRMNPRTAAGNFFRALLQVPGWEAMPPTLAAHLVQRNADPSYYSPYWNSAVEVVGNLDGYPNLTCQ